MFLFAAFDMRLRAVSHKRQSGAAFRDCSKGEESRGILLYDFEDTEALHAHLRKVLTDSDSRDLTQWAMSFSKKRRRIWNAVKRFWKCINPAAPMPTLTKVSGVNGSFPFVIVIVHWSFMD